MYLSIADLFGKCTQGTKPANTRCRVSPDVGQLTIGHQPFDVILDRMSADASCLGGLADAVPALSTNEELNPN